MPTNETQTERHGTPQQDRKTPVQTKRNGIAATLALPFFRQRKVKPRKGKGSYTRKGRTKVRLSSYVQRLLTLTGPTSPINHLFSQHGA